MYVFWMKFHMDGMLGELNCHISLDMLWCSEVPKSICLESHLVMFTIVIKFIQIELNSKIHKFGFILWLIHLVWIWIWYYLWQHLWKEFIEIHQNLQELHMELGFQYSWFISKWNRENWIPLDRFVEHDFDLAYY